MTDVTVYIPAYNAMPYLPAAVESVLAQSLTDFQLIIVNDGSTDNTANYLATLKDHRIRTISQENRGQSATANRALALCETEFFARMDADDRCAPQRLAKQRDFLRSHTEVGLVGTQAAPMGEIGRGNSLKLPLGHDDIYAALLQGRHAVVHPSTMVRTQVLKDLGGYWSLPLDDDYDMMLRLAEVAELANIDEVLYDYRIHERSANGSALRRVRFSYGYSCELARRRRAGLPEISHECYANMCRSRPYWKRGLESLDLYARGQYRAALGEMFGRQPVWGRARLAWAALCSPTLTCQRVMRMIRHH